LLQHRFDGDPFCGRNGNDNVRRWFHDSSLLPAGSHIVANLPTPT